MGDASLDDLPLDELGDLAERVATEAAHLVRERRSGIDAIDVKSSSSDLVTDVDRAAEEAIVAAITAARPDDGVVGEEGTGITGSTGIDWVIDPIDGTTSFVYGYPGYSVSVAAVSGGRSIVGAVADPVNEQAAGVPNLYAARLGRGATLNGEPITVSTPAGLSTSLVATGFSYDAARRGRQASVLSQVLPQIRDIRRIGSAAIELCHVAAGHVDGYFEVGLNPWDLGAGTLIATEAGAIALTEFPDDRESFCFASTPTIADELLAALDAAGARTV